MIKPVLRIVITRLFQIMGLSLAGLFIQRAIVGPNHIRVLSYHDTPPGTADGLRVQLEYFCRHFDPAAPGDLSALLSGERRRRPGLIVTFDDGIWSNYAVAAPLLERFGFVGWFFVPASLMGSTPNGDPPPDLAIHIKTVPPNRSSFMTWDELRDLRARGHMIGCHSLTHRRLGDQLDDATLQSEITDSKEHIENELGETIESFAWVGGDERSYGAKAANLIRRSAFRFGFMSNSAPVTPATDPLQINRTNVETSWPFYRVQFSLSGMLDLVYRGKRRRVDRLTASA